MPVLGIEVIQISICAFCPWPFCCNRTPIVQALFYQGVYFWVAESQRVARLPGAFEENNYILSF